VGDRAALGHPDASEPLVQPIQAQGLLDTTIVGSTRWNATAFW